MGKQNEQSATPETAPETAPNTAPVQEDPLAGLSDEGAEPFVDVLLGKARDLDDEKADVFARIDANRSVLRNIKATGALSEKQARAIDLFYPVRAAKPKPAAA